MWKSYKEIVFENIERFVPHKVLRKNLDPEYYNREMKRLKVRGSTAYNMRKLGEHHQADLSKQLLTARLNAQVTFLRFVLQDIGKVLQVCKKTFLLSKILMVGSLQGQ